MASLISQLDRRLPERQETKFRRGNFRTMKSKRIDATMIMSHMHSMCSDGKSISEICEYVWQSLGLEKGNAFSVVKYFWEGFGLSLPDARLIEASPICGGNALTEEVLEEMLRPKMQAFISNKGREERTEIPPHFRYRNAKVESESSLVVLENKIGVPLPKEYRQFLRSFGGGYLEACSIPARIPTPFGDHNLVQLNTVEDMLRTLDSEIVPRNLLCIGHGHLGIWTCISIAGIDHGFVYSFDSEMRYFWGEEKLSSLPGLDARVKEFFRLRDCNQLPFRPWGYENCYELSDGFNDFISGLKICGSR